MQKVEIREQKPGSLVASKSLGIHFNLDRAEGKLKKNRATLSESHISVETNVNNKMDINSVKKSFKRISKSALFSDIMKEEREREREDPI